MYTKKHAPPLEPADADPDPGRHGRELYDLAELYDIAYDWDITRELHFVVTCMECFGHGSPTRLLEPACGTGRNLAALGHMGFSAVGYDLNPATLAFAERRLREEGLAERCRALPGGMADFTHAETFDGAYTAINSFRYLLTDAEVGAHLRGTAALLPQGGVYVVDLSYAMPPRLRPRVIRWSGRRGPVGVRVCWRTREDRAASRSHETCTLEVRDESGTRTIATRHTTRLWQAEEFRATVAAHGFRLEALFDAAFCQLPEHERPHGGLDNLYHVLVRM